MSLRRCRSHLYGYTNIDFRTKNDDESLLLYQPWKNPKDFGTMGHSHYQLPFSEKHKLLKVSEKINSFATINSGCPDPRTYQTCRFYYKNNIPINLKSKLTSERISQLEESLKGKDVFNGESAIIPYILQERKKNKLKKKLLSGDSLNPYESQKMKDEIEEKNIIRNSSKDETLENKKIVKNYNDSEIIKNFLNKGNEDKINLKKLKEIKEELIKKYKNRKNFRQIFKDWDLSLKGEISIDDLHKMINYLGFTINMNEAKLLLSSVNMRNTETLNLNEFMKLIVKNNNEFDSELIKNNNGIIENNTQNVNNIREKLQKNLNENYKKEQISYLEEFFRLKIPKLFDEINQNNCKSDNVDYETYKKILRTFNLPQHFFDEGTVDNLYEKYKVNKNNYNTEIQDKSNKSGMNFKLFAETVINDALNSDKSFFSQKNIAINHLEDKINRSKSELNINHKALERFNTNKQQIREDFLSQIINRKKRDKLNNKGTLSNKELNASQPSTEYIYKIFNNKTEIYNKLNQIEKSFEVRPENVSYIPKTRSGANPKGKNTFLDHQPVENSGMYMSEKDRFDIIGLNNKIDFIFKDKQKRINCINAKSHRISSKQNEILQNISDKCLYEEQKEKFSQFNRSKRLYNFEVRKKLQNEIIE